jgi:hypothetical protein
MDAPTAEPGVAAAPPPAAAASCWQWPLPPQRERAFALPPGVAQPCRIETQSRLTLHGELLAFDPAMRRLQFRAAGGGPDASLPFMSLRRLTLTVALQPQERPRRSARQRLPAAAQERDYRLEQVGQENAQPLTGRCAGHVEAAEGLYLFCPIGGEGALQRVFVPRSAYSRCEFGASEEEKAARHWIASPAQLLQALAEPAKPATPLVQSLQALGLATQAQLTRMLQQLDGKAALGDALVGAGQLTRSNLQTALAHTMGFPLVDLDRFPRDPLALAMVPRELALSHRMMPLLRDGERLIVAVDRPGRVLALRQVPGYERLPLVPVLALKSQILQALQRLGADAPAPAA